MATPAEWVAGARLRTLPMAVCPVLIGTAAALSTTADGVSFASVGPLPAFWLVTTVPALLALVVALALQVGVNYANDYSDGIRGTDDQRVGPMRLTGTQAAPAQQVKLAAFLSFGVAAAAGAGIVLMTQQWWMIAVGIVCVLAAWWYTGGSRPYGYMGLGEVMVFVFFGLVATLGTSFAVVATASQAGYVMDFPGTTAALGAVSHGLIASALLMANNIRDIPTDRQAGKRTVAVRLGQTRSRWAYCLMIAVALTIPLSLSLTGGSTWFWLVVLAWPAALVPLRTMWPWRTTRATGTALVPVLQQTGVVGMAFAVAYSAALLIGA